MWYNKIYVASIQLAIGPTDSRMDLSVSFLSFLQLLIKKAFARKNEVYAPVPIDIASMETQGTTLCPTDTGSWFIGQTKARPGTPKHMRMNIIMVSSLGVSCSFEQLNGVTCRKSATSFVEVAWGVREYRCPRHLGRVTANIYAKPVLEIEVPYVAIQPAAVRLELAPAGV